MSHCTHVKHELATKVYLKLPSKQTITTISEKNDCCRIEMRPCEHDRTVLSHPLNGTVPARRGTAAAATRRAPSCTSLPSPCLAPPSARRAPSHRPTGRAAAWRGVRGTSGRASTTHRSRSTGRWRVSGAAAGRPAARAPWAPVADPSSGPSLAAAGPAPSRLGTQPARLGLASLALRLVCKSSKTKLKPKKENKDKT